MIKTFVIVSILVVSLMACGKATTTSTSTSGPTSTPPTSTPVPTAKSQDVAKLETLKKDLTENFGTPGYKTSWYDNIIDVLIQGDTVIAKTNLTSGSKQGASNICSAISGFVYAKPNSNLGLDKVQVHGLNGELLVNRQSVSASCQ